MEGQRVEGRGEALNVPSPPMRRGGARLWDACVRAARRGPARGPGPHPASPSAPPGPPGRRRRRRSARAGWGRRGRRGWGEHTQGRGEGEGRRERQGRPSAQQRAGKRGGPVPVSAADSCPARFIRVAPYPPPPTDTHIPASAPRPPLLRHHYHAQSAERNIY